MRGIASALGALLSGTVFGLGLAISGMVDPNKVLAFLTVVGPWEPDLLLVMGAAATIATVGYRLALKAPPLFSPQFHLPQSVAIDQRLMAGAAVFGVGWGMAGYCPGPAITALASGAMEPALFVVSMLIGSQLARLFLARQ